MSDMKGNELGQMNFTDTLFVNKKAFRVSIFAAVICFLYIACKELFLSDTPGVFSIASSVVLIAALIGMGYCSKNYRDNAVKNIIGVILGVTFSYDLRFFDKDYSFFSTTNIVIGAVKIALGLALIVLYIFARDSKRSNYKLITYVHIAFFTFTAFVILNNIPYFIRDWSGDTPYLFIQDIAGMLAFIFTYFSVVCAACTVDRYKMIRDYYTSIGKWTQERRSETKKELFG